MRKEITEGNIYKVMLKLAIPIIITQITQILYNLIDTFWLGKIGKEAIAAPTITWPILMTIFFFGSGFSTSALALVSQYVGKKDFENAEKVVGQLLILSFVLSLFFTVFMYFSAGFILKLIKTPIDVFEYAKNYLKIVSFSFPFAYFSYVFSTTMRASGDPKTPLKINLITLSINLILDPILIFGYFNLPKMYVSGAALATTISNIIYAGISLFILETGRKGIKIRIIDLKPEKEMIKKIIKIGMPAAFSNSLNGFGFTIIMAIVASFGSVATAAYGIGMRIINLISGFIFSISQAASIMLGQNIGADKINRADKILFAGIKLNLLISSIISLLVFVSADKIAMIFIKDVAVISLSVLMIKIFAPSVPFFGILFPTIFYLNVAGRTDLSSILSLSRLYLIRIPAVYFLSKIYAVKGIFIGLALSNILSALLASYFLINRKWLKRIV